MDARQADNSNSVFLKKVSKCYLGVLGPHLHQTQKVHTENANEQQ